MTSVAPNTALTSASMDWGVYYTYAVQCMLDGTAIDTDWCKGFAEGADKITALNDKTVAEGTEEKVKEVEDALIDGSLHVFDTSAFTVDGKELDTYKKGDTEYISDGYFHESEYGSAPAFDIAIDGIHLLQNKKIAGAAKRGAIYDSRAARAAALLFSYRTCKGSLEVL